MEGLIIKPLQLARVSTVIIVDALDEWKDEEPPSAILSVLGWFVKRVPRVKCFITSRPEPWIKTGFWLPLLVDLTNVFIFHDTHPSLINDDIQLFLKYELSELAQWHWLARWPCDYSLNLLSYRAAGLFVYADATVKLLDSSTHLPKQQLDVIINLPECPVRSGPTRLADPRPLFYYLSYLPRLLTADIRQLKKPIYKESLCTRYHRLKNLLNHLSLSSNPCG